MINAQSLTLMLAYEPYLDRVRIMALEGGRNGYIAPHMPDYDTSILAFSFDVEFTEVEVWVSQFCTLDAARSALIMALEFNNKIVRMSTITDMVTRDEFSQWSNCQ